VRFRSGARNRTPGKETPMDIFFVGLTFVMLALAFGLVQLCERV
jgi:hypothetical protein